MVAIGVHHVEELDYLLVMDGINKRHNVHFVIINLSIGKMVFDGKNIDVAEMV